MKVALVPFVCPTHGWLCDTVPSATVYCRRCRTWLPPQARRSRKLTGMAAALRGRTRSAANNTASDQHLDPRIR